MSTVTVTVDRVATTDKGSTYIYHGNDEKLFVGRDVSSLAGSLQPGDNATLELMQGKYGPMVVAINGNKGQRRAWNGNTKNAGPAEPTFKGQRIGFVARWVLDAEIASGAKFTAASIDKSIDRIGAILAALNEKKD